MNRRRSPCDLRAPRSSETFQGVRRIDIDRQIGEVSNGCGHRRVNGSETFHHRDCSVVVTEGLDHQEFAGKIPEAFPEQLTDRPEPTLFRDLHRSPLEEEIGLQDHPETVRLILERGARGTAPLLPIPLREDPRLSDLYVEPHPLADYDPEEDPA